MKVAILGAGPAGLYLAYLLKRRRPETQVRLVEQNRADSTFGFGVVFSDRALEFLKDDDAGTYDAGRDAGVSDAGVDAGTDAGRPDAGGSDAGRPDAGRPDAGADAGRCLPCCSSGRARSVSSPNTRAGSSGSRSSSAPISSSAPTARTRWCGRAWPPSSEPA